MSIPIPYNTGLTEEQIAEAFRRAINDMTDEQITALLAEKVDKQEGFSLMSAADKSKLDGLENYDDTDVKADIAEVTSQTAVNRSTLGYQRKNLLQNKGTTTTKNGVTFTVNADGSVTVNGTATSSASFGLTPAPFPSCDGIFPKRVKLVATGTSENLIFGVQISNTSSSGSVYNYVNTGNDVVADMSTWTGKYAYFYLNVPNGKTVSNVTVYPMVIDADVEDNYTYELYRPSVQEQIDSLTNHVDTEIKAEIAKTSEESALNRSTLGYQRKNILMNNCQNKTINGITATVNADGSITLNGSNTFGHFILFYNIQTGTTTTTPSGQYIDNKKFIPNGKYIVSGGTSELRIQVLYSTDNASELILASTSDTNEVTFTVTDTHKYVWCRIFVSKNATFDNVTFYPMLRYAEITDATYEPYKPSVEERLAALEGKFAALEGGVT